MFFTGWLSLILSVYTAFTLTEGNVLWNFSGNSFGKLTSRRVKRQLVKTLVSSLLKHAAFPPSHWPVWQPDSRTKTKEWAKMCLLLKYHLLTTFNAKKRTVDQPDVWSGDVNRHSEGGQGRRGHKNKTLLCWTLLWKTTVKRLFGIVFVLQKNKIWMRCCNTYSNIISNEENEFDFAVWSDFETNLVKMAQSNFLTAAAMLLPKSTVCDSCWVKWNTWRVIK